MTRSEYFIARAEWHEAEARELRRLAALEKFSSSMDGFARHPVYTEVRLPNALPREVTEECANISKHITKLSKEALERIESIEGRRR